MNVQFHEAARTEFDDAVLYYAAISPTLSAEFLAEAERAVGKVVERPNAWQPFGKHMRRYIFNRFPFGLVYRLEEGKIKVYAVMHLKRRPGYWHNRLGS